MFGGGDLKKLDLSQGITILANLGVIAGIVFLALELRQNNALMGHRSESFSNPHKLDSIRRLTEMAERITHRQ